LGGNIINLVRYWSNIKGNNSIDNIHIIIPSDINSLPMQILEENLTILQLEVELEDGSGEEFEQF
jgi:hypothetical protein